MITFLNSVFNLDEDDFIVCNGINFKSVFRQTSGFGAADTLQKFQEIVNVLGEKSAVSQNLKQPITSLIKFANTDQRLYIKIKGNQVVGFVKTGEKNLFYRDYKGSIKQIKPTCVLDFFVNEKFQRGGYGKEIFQKFLRSENKNPEKLAYDRPSHKLISFLKKHYQLTDFVPQNNNYVIFDNYFSAKEDPKTQTKESSYVNTYSNRISKQNNDKFSRNNAIVSSFKTEPTLTSISNNPKVDRNTSMRQIKDSLQTLMAQQLTKNISYKTFTEKNIQQHANDYSSLGVFGMRQNDENISKQRKLKQLSCMVPWATEQSSQRNNYFRTTSNTYGRGAY